MARLQSQGKCQLCQATFSKSAMSRHLSKCVPVQEAARPESKKAKKGKLFHLVVQGKYQPEYWLHLEVPATATLADLDAFLRDIWLECCGHLSAFTIGGTTYSARADAALAAWADEFDDADVEVKLGEVLRPGMTIAYEYDFGSTTNLTLKAVSEREGIMAKKEPVRLLARNDPPLIPCGTCKQRAATRILTEEAHDESGWVCDECAGEEEEESWLPVVNSPRTGVCGYTG